ncbi:MAG: hypothetical protein ACM30E_02900, partial [Nitrososphaerales archaeon]
MFFKRGKWAFGMMALLTVLAVMASCTPAPAPTQGGTGASGTSAIAAPPSGSQAGGSAASLDGTWKGEINVAGQVIGIQLNFKGQGGTIDIPAQGSRDLRMESFASQGNQV